jgi:hypothetical protein
MESNFPPGQPTNPVSNTVLIGQKAEKNHNTTASDEHREHHKEKRINI